MSFFLLSSRLALPRHSWKTGNLYHKEMPGCFTTRLGWNFYITKSYVSRPRIPISLRCVTTTCGSSTEQGMCCFESATTQHELNDNGSEATLKCSARWRLEFCAVSGGMRETLPRVLHAVRRCPSRMDNASCNVSCMKSGRISSDSKPKEEASRCGRHQLCHKHLPCETLAKFRLWSRNHISLLLMPYRNNSQPFRHHFFQYPLQYLRNLAPENFPRNQSSFLSHRFFFACLLPIWWIYKYNISISMGIIDESLKISSGCCGCSSKGKKTDPDGVFGWWSMRKKWFLLPTHPWISSTIQPSTPPINRVTGVCHSATGVRHNHREASGVPTAFLVILVMVKLEFQEGGFNIERIKCYPPEV